MTEKPFDQIVILLSLAFLFSLFALIGSWKTPRPLTREPETKQINTEPPEPEKYDYPKSNPKINYFVNWYKPTHFVRETRTEVETEYQYLGYYYLTAYCPQECGFNGSNYPTGWRTASGAICHRAEEENRLTEPTTCAIDRKYHSFGTVFYIPYFDRTFIAEDTGSAVKGYHLDLFYEDYGSMAAFPTGYYEVYSVTYIETEKEVEYFDFEKVKGISHIVYMQDHY